MIAAGDIHYELADRVQEGTAASRTPRPT
jgi:hypothetical protein